MTAKKPETWRKALPRRLGELQHTVEKQVRKNWDRATDLLPPTQRKAVKRFTADVDRAREDLRKRRDKMVADARKRAERFTVELQKRIERAVTPMTRRLDVASRAEVDRLHKRLHELERRVQAHGHHPA